METLAIEVEDALAAKLEEDARRRGISLSQAYADHVHLLAYEALHGTVSEEELAELDEAMAEDDRGDHASDAEMKELFRKYGA
ncbi:MAG: hypothetical protein HXY28_14620 [Hydrogenophilaceae bacterium]|jgi:predicted transcriptional regulator|nr:hypothetical protein [Hydrogenophilaceae bacterium]